MPYILAEEPHDGLLVTFANPVQVTDLVAAARSAIQRFPDAPRRFGIWDFSGIDGFDPSVEELHELARVHQSAPGRTPGYRHGLVGVTTMLELLRDDYVLIMEFLTGATQRELTPIEVFDTLEEARRDLYA